VDETIAFKIGVEKKESLQKLADKMGLNLSSFLRMICHERLDIETTKGGDK